ncbi:TPA: TRAM domain-containing protein [Candidatus Bipolaricaulota bacterium]|nr:TRAM domain-containing protein [Candidatus Bipolaricaulota bacterium]
MGGKFMLEFSFYFILTALGALISWVTRLSPPLFGLEGWETNLLLGGLGGLTAAGLIEGITKALGRRLAHGGGRGLLLGLVFALIGSLLGLVAYLVLESILPEWPLRGLVEGLVILFLALLGFRIGYLRPGLLLRLFQGGMGGEGEGGGAPPKLLDTSVIIDGRIGDIVKTGFIEGKILIPQFILDELHNIADSADNLRRRKGRRGLDILGELTRNPGITVETVERGSSGSVDADRELIQLAKELGAEIITTDYNLNKVAKVEGIRVLNINELANAVKPRFLPGEELEVEVIDRGEEIGQGVGYLDDGTMVVVENGRRFIGKKIQVVVHSSLQTEAGKMLFVRPKGEYARR